jgi:hypothetical protein
MIVFDLKCGQAHIFEAWFGSSSDYADQQSRGLIACPICNDTSIEKAAMAPAVPAKGNQDRGAQPMAMAGADPAAAKAMLAKLAEMQKALTDSSEYVGGRFAEEARAIHYGETDARGIFGETTASEADALRDEGISAMPLPCPVRPRGGDA